MTERAIIFSGEMVRAILSGQKTQIRSPIERVKGIYGGDVTSFQASDTPGYDFAMRDKRGCWNELERNDLLRRCPYGQIGSRLWVRETFCICEDLGKDWTEGMGDTDRFVHYSDREERYAVPDEYEVPKAAKENHHCEGEDDHWRIFGPIPSIHMPRWASRITLEITDIRVQRVQEISYPDCESEVGVNNMDVPIMWRFEVLWNSIYSETGFGWDVNPWVWAITFRRGEKNG